MEIGIRGLLPIAGGVVLIGAFLAGTRNTRGRASADALRDAAARLDYRTSESRVSGGFPYRPWKRGSSGPDPLGEAPRPVLEAVAAIERVRHSQRREPDLHARGLTHLLLRNWNGATETLDDAVRQQTRRVAWSDGIASLRDAGLLVDVAAAHYERAGYSQSPRDYVMAAEAAERAWRIERTPETAWNRALAIEALHLRETARAAWNDYLVLDGQSPWSTEARIRLRKLAEPTSMELWDREQPRLERAVSANDRVEIDRIVRAFPGEARKLCEKTSMPQWARDDHGSDTGAARLSLCREIGNAILRFSGESLLAVTVAHIDRSAPLQRRSIVRALSQYADALDHYLRFDFTGARPLLASAEEALSRAGSPVAYTARMYRLNCDRHGDFKRVLAETDAWLADRSFDWDSFPVLEAQVRWIRGLQYLREGHPQSAIGEYERARERFDRVREADSVTSMLLMLSEAYQYVGDDDAAWKARFAVLEHIDALGRVHPHLVEVLGLTARAALVKGLPFVALLFFERQIAGSENPPEPYLRFEALLWRSAAYRSISDETRSAADLEEAGKLVSQIPDRKLSEFALQAPEVVQGRLAKMSDLAERQQVLAAAVAHARARDDAFRLSQLFLVQGIEFARAHRWTDAITVLLEGASQFEKERASLSDEERRSSFVSERRRLYDVLATAYCRAGDSVHAFEALERGRARTLFDDVTRGPGDPASLISVGAIQGSLPLNTLLVSYARIDDKPAVWLLSRTGLRLVEDLTDQDLPALADQFRIAVTSGTEEETSAASKALYTAVIRPWIAQVGSYDRLVFIPDAPLAAVPFGALRDPATGRFLVERHVVSVAPSANVYVSCLARDQRSHLAGGRTLIVAPATSAASAGAEGALLASSAEVREVAALYRSTEILEGSTATSTAFLAAAPTASVIHFAGHAGSEEGSAARLVFAPDRGKRPVLTVEDIRDLNLRATRLVVLAACASGREPLGESDQGTSTLARAFLAAGAPAVIASYWDVEDDAAAQWSRIFHGFLAKGMDPAAALRETQLQMLAASSPSSRVRSWAAFTLIGGVQSERIH
ncbi:MAG: CHAT domain-containing protein [Acidobacteriota bacterium]